jgi:hydroxymethylbilane synthase
VTHCDGEDADVNGGWHGAGLRFGTRGSTLALWQTRRVAARLVELGRVADTEEVVIRTRGDDDVRSALPDIGGRGVFTEELERALLEGRIDVAVHSLKDLPVEQRPGLIIGAVCMREDPRDALITRTGAGLDAIAAAAVVGTSSTRRMSQLLAARADLDVRPIRGNVETRIAKVDGGEYDATVLAAAGIRRLGLDDRIAEVLPIATFLPAPGQGALAVQCRADDERARALIDDIDDAEARDCTDAERGFLAGLGGGCSMPIAAHAVAEGDDIILRGFVGARDGGRSIRLEDRFGRGEHLEGAAMLARRALAEGAAELLE